MKVEVTIDARWALLGARAAFALRHAIGDKRAQRFATWIAFRFARVRIGDGPWRRGIARSE